MTGWWSLGERAVISHTWPDWPGVYMLAKSIRIPRYVGRSDDNVRGRLLKWVGSRKYSLFSVEHIRNPVEAFLRECGLYHYYRNQLDNKVHPGRPRGCRDKCPKCSYFG